MIFIFLFITFFILGKTIRSRRSHVSFWKDKDKGFDFLGFSSVIHVAD